MNIYYQDDKVTLYHGDALEVDAWLTADVVICDPPYGINHSTHGKNAPIIKGESRTGRSAKRVLTAEHVAIRDAVLALWAPRPALVFGHWRAPRPSDTRMRLIWDKIHPGMGGVGVWKPSEEEIYIVGDWPNPRTISRTDSNIIRFKSLRGKSRPDHPTPKPVDLMEHLIQRSPDGVVADPFAGSGATLIAARNLGRKAIGVELDEKHCETTAKRLAAIAAQDTLDLFKEAA